MHAMDLTFPSRPKEFHNHTHFENLLDTLGSNMQNNADVIDIITGSEERVSFNKSLLIVFSKTIRKCLADLPCCDRPSSITLVDIKFGALKNIKELIENSLRGEDTELNTQDIEDFFKAADALGMQMSSLWNNFTLNQYSEYKGKKAIKVQVGETKNEAETVEVVPNNKEEEDLYDEKPLYEENPDHKDEDDSLQGEGRASEDQEAMFSDLCSVSMSMLSLNKETENKSPDDEKKIEAETVEQEANKEEEDEDLYDEKPLEICLDEDNIESNDATEESLTLPHEVPDYKDEDDSLQGPGLSEEKGATPSLTSEAEQASSDPESRLSCVICKKTMRGPSYLREHYSSTHFFDDLFAKYVVGHNKSQTICTIDGCNKNYRDKNGLVRHIGSTHNKIKDILQTEGIEIPTTVGRVGGGSKRRSENLIVTRSVKIKTAQIKAVDNNNKRQSKVKCDICEKDFATKHNMERHKKNLHNL